MIGFPTLEISFSFSVQIRYHVQFVLLDLSENVSEGFRGLWQSWSPTTLRAFFSTSSPCLHCSMSCLCLQARTRIFLPEKCCPPSICPPSPATSCSFPQCYCQQSLVVITPVLGWFHSYRCWGHSINISPLSSTGTHERVTQAKRLFHVQERVMS